MTQSVTVLELVSILGLVLSTISPSYIIRSTPLWWYCFLATLLFAYVATITSWLAVLATIALAVLLWVYQRSTRFYKLLAWPAVVLLCLGLATHSIPGFEPILLTEVANLDGEGSLFRIALSFDKAIVGVLLLRFLFGQVTWTINARHWMVILASLVLVFSVVWPLALSYRFKVGSYLFYFAFVNLFVTCLAEEAFFRGFFQRPLSGVMKTRVWNFGIVIFIGLIFAAVHPASFASPQSASVYFFVGTVYAGAFQYTRRLEVSIVLHFLVNIVHIVFFIYPA